MRSVPLPLECIGALKIITLMEYFVFGAALVSKIIIKEKIMVSGEKIVQFTVEKRGVLSLDSRLFGIHVTRNSGLRLPQLSGRDSERLSALTIQP